MWSSGRFRSQHGGDADFRERMTKQAAIVPTIAEAAKRVREIDPDATMEDNGWMLTITADKEHHAAIREAVRPLMYPFVLLKFGGPKTKR